MEWVEWALYAGVGTVAGFFAGLLGIGGGAIVGPLLIVIFVSLLDFNADASAYLAIGTAMASIALTSFVSASTHARRGNIDWTPARRLSLGAIVGGLGGVHLALLIPAPALKFILAVFLSLNAFFFLFPSRRKIGAASPATAKESTSPAAAEAGIVAAVIGAISAALGIGGGVIMVPYLTRRGMPLHKAIGTSAFVVLPLSVAAALGYAFSDGGRNMPLPEDAAGFVYLPALAGIALFSLVTAHIGASLTARLPGALLRRLFALLMLLIAGRLLVIVLFSA